MRRAHRARHPEAGVSITELLIAMMLFNLVIVAAFTSVNVMQNQTRKTTDRFAATGEAQTIADRISKDLRAAVVTSPGGAAFAAADANDVVFYADLGGTLGPTKVHAYLTTDVSTGVKLFHEDITLPDAGGSSGNYTYSSAASNRIDGKYIDSSKNVFEYYDDDGNVVGPTPITDVATLKSIAAVRVTVRVQVTPRSPVVEIESLVHVRNVDYNPQD
jgi:hypothetical protein